MALVWVRASDGTIGKMDAAELPQWERHGYVRMNAKEIAANDERIARERSTRAAARLREFHETGGAVQTLGEERIGRTAAEGAALAGGGVLGGASPVSPAEQVVAGVAVSLEHALAARTFGFSRAAILAPWAILEAAGVEGAEEGREALAFAAERSPTAALVGEFGGALTPGSLVARAAATAERAVAAGVGRVAGRVVGRAAGGAAGAFSFQVASNLMRAELDPEHTAEIMTAHLGPTAIIGGVVGGVLGVGGAIRGGFVRRAAARRAAAREAEVPIALGDAAQPSRATVDAAQATGDFATPGILPEVENLIATSRVNGVPLGADDFLARARGASPEAERAWNLWLNKSASYDAGARELASLVQRGNSAARMVQLESLGRHKAADILRAASRAESPFATAQAARNLVREFGEDAGAKLADAATWGERASLRRVRDLADATVKRIDDMTGRLDAADLPGSVFMELDGFKQIVGKLSKPGRMAFESKDNDALNVIRGWYEGLRLHLEDGALYADAATIQREANAAWRELLRNEQLFSRMFLTRGPEVEAFNPNYVADTWKIAKLLPRLGRFASDIHVQAFTHHFRAQQEFARTARRVYSLSEQAAKAADEIDTVAPRALELFERTTRDVSAVNQLEELIARDAVIRAGRPPIPETIFGTAKELVTRKYREAADPILAESQRRTLARAAAGRANTGVVSRISRAVGRATAAVGRVTEPIVETRTLIRAAPAIGFSIERALEEARRYRDDPASGTARIATRLSRVIDAMPDTGALMAGTISRGIGHLATRLPRDLGASNPLRRGEAPSEERGEVDRFREAARAVIDPVGTIEAMADGYAVREHRDTLSAVYPRLWQTVQSMVVAELADATNREEPLSFAQRMRIALAFDVPADASLRPALFARLQAPTGPSAPGPGAATTQAQKTRESRAGEKIAGAGLSEMQGLEARGSV